MIFDTTKFKKNTNWHDFFAWIPVKLYDPHKKINNTWAWLETIERKYCEHISHRPGGSTYVFEDYLYRLKEDS